MRGSRGSSNVPEDEARRMASGLGDGWCRTKKVGKQSSQVCSSRRGVVTDPRRGTRKCKLRSERMNGQDQSRRGVGDGTIKGDEESPACLCDGDVGVFQGFSSFFGWF